MEQEKKIKIAIIILAILLALCLLALGGIFVYNKLANSTPATVTVPDNLITGGEHTDPSGTADVPATGTTDSGKTTSTTEPAPTEPINPDPVQPDPVPPTKDPATEPKKAATIDLYNKHPDENNPFQVKNMFPGDTETKYFRVQVSYHDKITVHYKATVRDGYEKLAEVLKVRIKLLTTGETMYDGLMRDMPDSVTYKLASPESATADLYYEITAYLDTSVGNEYQKKDLIADFRWWVEETGNLDDSPQTGDNSMVILWAVSALCSGFALVFLIFSRKRKENR